MVAMMGFFGAAFWLLKGSMIAIWYAHMPSDFIIDMNTSHQYLIWTSIKCFVRAIGVFFQVYFFVNINSSFGRQREVIKNRWNFFYVPTMMVSLFSIFFNSVIDGYGGFVEENVKAANLCTIVSTLYRAGAPIHLGFCIHIFLHFFIINRRMGIAFERILDRASSQHSRRNLTPVLEHDIHDDSDGLSRAHLIRPGRKAFFKTH